MCRWYSHIVRLTSFYGSASFSKYVSKQANSTIKNVFNCVFVMIFITQRNLTSRPRFQLRVPSGLVTRHGLETMLSSSANEGSFDAGYAPHHTALLSGKSRSVDRSLWFLTALVCLWRFEDFCAASFDVLGEDTLTIPLENVHCHQGGATVTLRASEPPPKTRNVDKTTVG